MATDLLTRPLVEPPITEEREIYRLMQPEGEIEIARAEGDLPLVFTYAHRPGCHCDPEHPDCLPGRIATEIWDEEDNMLWSFEPVILLPGDNMTFDWEIE